ncbi:hypothetical protein [Thermoflavimicrobium daqui]|jgi:hypothetical protein|uniref:Lipoprotein n=1 Tax=Thermoflavimicrobium daqui TaxID=2137476 RepID=A0A364K5I7_9BACL|nr:hypothetical protein [Thermoflavimicrobium daqui]RAL25564.1 hypothetical protein DL897_05600 [Thermoflavimicrobium daqui]
MRKVYMISLCLFILLTAGCGILPTKKTNLTPSEQEEQGKATTKEQQTIIINNNQVNNQTSNQQQTISNTNPPANQNHVNNQVKPSGPISFKAHDFEKQGTGYIPPRLPTAGAWLYTQNNHPSNITNEFDWDQMDVLHFQLNDPKYIGYLPIPKKVELVQGNVIIVVKMKYDSDYAKFKLAPRRYLEIPRGVVSQDAQISVQSDTGEQLRTF